ncbi:MAG: hypothetical protein SVY53_04950 [Chloroflexota bacterium]|nr:hypothetical protein [Chloroflexota bacterium]
MDHKDPEILFDIPHIPDGETLRYEIRRAEGQEIVAYQTRVVNRIQKDNNEYYKVHGLTEYVGKGSMEETAFYQIDNRLRLVSFSKQIRTRSGCVLIDEEEQFEDELVDLPINTVSQSCTSAFGFRGGPFTPKSKITYHWINPLGCRPMKIHADISTDTITVPAGTFECYKAVCIPDIDSMIEQSMPADFVPPPGFHALMSSFAPPNYCWFSQNAPHYEVRSEGTIINAVPFISPDPGLEELVSIGS